MHRVKTRQSRSRRLLGLTLGVSASLASHANPTAPTVAAGTVTFANPNPTTLEITNSPAATSNDVGSSAAQAHAGGIRGERAQRIRLAVYVSDVEDLECRRLVDGLGQDRDGLHLDVVRRQRAPVGADGAPCHVQHDHRLAVDRASDPRIDESVLRREQGDRPTQARHERRDVIGSEAQSGHEPWDRLAIRPWQHADTVV